MDHDLRPVVADHRHNLEEVSSMIGPQVQDLAVVLFTNRERMLDSVPDVLIGDPVPTGGAEDFPRAEYRIAKLT